MAGAWGDNPAGRRLLALSAGLCLLLCTAVVVRRGVAVWTATHTAPGVCTNTGFEEESLLGLWRTVHHQPTFPDPTQPPYAAAYFNWLFYFGYAVPLRAVVTHWGDPLLPLAARAVTAAGALLGTVLLFRLLRTTPGNRGAAAALAAFAFTGPLLAWWICTARPDVWALTLEIGGAALLLRPADRRPAWSLAGALVCFYLAWACKQTAVGFLATAVVFLAWRGRWRGAAVLALGSLALWAATLLLLGPAYRAAFHAGVSQGVLDAETGWRNFADAAAKSSPLLLLAIGAGWYARRRAAAPPGPPLLVFGAIGAVLTFPLFFAAAFKLGAWSNYYFTPAVMLVLWAHASCSRGGATGWLALTCAAMAALQGVMLGEGLGRVTLRSAADQMARRWTVWGAQPEPRFASDTRYNLPWLNPRSPPFVLAYNYPLDRAHGRAFANGGIGGLIESGYFASLLLPDRTGDTYDGGSLRRYRRETTVDDMAVYRRITPAAP
jgi:hypothetical protein